MEQAVPLIYTKEALPPGMAWWGRAAAGLIAGAALAMLVIGAGLSPGGLGHGTHTQLGLGQCNFLYRTGIPCPSCGFTTSVSYFAHGRFLGSFYVQPMGFVIALMACMTVWVGGYVAVTGRPVHRLLGFIPGRWWLMVLCSFGVAAWGWKILIHLKGWDRWPL